MDTVRKHYLSLSSTNTEAKRLARLGEKEGLLIVADEQSDGRGRNGHSFLSIRGGLYFSLLLRPSFDDYTLITPAAAVAVAQACEDIFPVACKIKWVNDIFIDEKKVCGILTESDIAQGWAVLGIGINISTLPGDAPDIAGTLRNGEPDMELRDKLLEAVLAKFSALYDALPDKSFVSEYRERSYLDGHKLHYCGRPADYIGIDDDFRLLIVTDEGEEMALDSGEITVIR